MAERAEQRRNEEVAAAEAAAAELPASPPPLPQGPGLATGAYRVVDVIVEVARTTSRNRAWDVDPEPAPDLRLTLHVDGEEVGECDAGREVFAGRCHIDERIAVDADTVIQIEVWDEDALADDRIGVATLAKPAHWGTDLDLPMVPQGRVIKATLRLAAEPTWWDRYQANVFGLGGGVGFALLVLLLFRRQLLVRDPQLPPPPRCGHCNQLIMGGAVHCQNCGAKL